MTLCVVKKSKNRISPGMTFLGIICMALLTIGLIVMPPAFALQIPSVYYIKRDGGNYVAIAGTGAEVFRVGQNDASQDILQLVHDKLEQERGTLGGKINMDNSTYFIHHPIKFRVPIALTMTKSVLLFDAQPKGDVGIVTTQAKVTVNGGTFDCNKSVQTQNWIHGLRILPGSEGSLIKGVEARNCPTAGNGFVIGAAYSNLTNSRSHHNDGDGVYLRSCDYCIVQKSYFNYNGINGIDVSDQDGLMAGHTLVYNNTANWNHDGINLDSTYYANVTGNVLYGNWIGIAEYHSTADNLNNLITGNKIRDSQHIGIYEQGYIPWHDPYISDYSTIRDNIMISDLNLIKINGQNSIVTDNSAVCQ